MIKLKPKERVYYRGRLCHIRKEKSLEEVYITDEETLESFAVKISELQDKAPEESKNVDPYDRPFESYSIKQQDKAKWRLSIIKPFLNEMKGDKKALKKVAKANSLNVSTLYKWIEKFEHYGHLGALVTSEKLGGKDLGRLDAEVEKQIESAIDSKYLESKEIDTTYKHLVEVLTDLGLQVPSENTLRRRINRRSKQEQMARRLGPRTAGQQFDPKPGTIPNVDAPLSLVQIDHTKLDIMLVDGEKRSEVERPWLTLLIDVFSRMVLGFYISYDPPSSFSIGRAVIHAMLRKEKYLESLGLGDISWPCWGKMTALHCDNGKDFRGKMMKSSCAAYKINLKWRPVKKPEFGGHIERLMGTIASQLKDLSGSTKVSKEFRSKFKPEKSAVMTLSDFEKWFTIWVTEEYHTKPHKGIGGATPLERWVDGIQGRNGFLGIGLPDVETNEDKLHFDWLPMETRTVQRTGVHIDNLRYYAGILIPWINALEEESTGKKKKKRELVFRTDPRDISSIYFLNPSDSRYHEIPCTMNFKPDKVSKWDHRRAIKELKSKRIPVTDRNIIDTHRRLCRIEEEAKRQTTHQRRKNEREKRMEKEERKVVPVLEQNTSLPPAIKKLSTEIKAYDELEYTTRRSFK